jgi:hypothetical protein
MFLGKIARGKVEEQLMDAKNYLAGVCLERMQIPA